MNKEDKMGDYVEQEAYEALQAEYDKLVAYTRSGIECFASPCSDHSGINTPSFDKFFEQYGGRCLICEVDGYETLQAECEALRKDAERYRYIKKGNQWIVAATQTGFQIDEGDLDDLIDAEMEQKV